MIVNCPNCDTRFVIPKNALGDDGRKVRCARCEHVWLQKPDEDEALVEDLVAEQAALDQEEAQAEQQNEIPEEPIPQSVMPDPIDHEPSEDKTSASIQGDMKRGIAAGVAVFFITTLLFVLMKGILTNVIPGLTPVYAAMGFNSNLAGENLVFDQVSVDLLPVPENEGEDTQVYQIKGNIINLGLKQTKIPIIKAQLWRGEKNVGDPQYFTLNSNVVDGEDTLNFSKIISAPNQEDIEANEIRLSFVMKEGA